jgi:hypothetical protein
MANPDNEVIVSKTDISNMVEQQIAERLDEEDQDFDDMELDSDSDIEEEVKIRQHFDVFDDVINKRVEKGDFVKWKIIKDGEIIATRNGCSSWEDIHKEFGKGHYQIRPRSSNSGSWLKSQTLALGEYRGDGGDIKEAKENSFDMNSFLQFQREDREYMNEEISRRERAAEQRAEKQFGLVTSMMGERKSDNSFEFMKLMMEQQNRADESRREEERRREDQRREDQRRADERFEKLLASLAAPKDDNSTISAIEHFDKIRQVEKEAKEEAKREYEEIERKAKEKAEELAENKGDKSITEKAIEGIMETAPILAKVFAKNAGVAAPNPQRRIAAPKRKKKPMKVVGLSGESKQTVENPQKTSKINEGEAEKRQKAKAAVTEICAPIILGSIMEEENADVCANKCLEKLESWDIKREVISLLFVADDFVQLSKEQGLYEIAQASGREGDLETWLKELYECLTKPIQKENKTPQVVGLTQPTL